MLGKVEVRGGGGWLLLTQKGVRADMIAEKLKSDGLGEGGWFVRQDFSNEAV
jgi:hypothetical protein